MMTESSAMESSVRFLNRPGGQVDGPYADLGRHAIVLTPANLGFVVANLPALRDSRSFDGLVLDGFDRSNPIEPTRLLPLAACTREVTIKESCKGADLSPLADLENVVSISTLLPRPRQLRLAMFPLIWRATLGRMDQASALAGASKLETLRLFRGLDLEKCGWDWMASLSSLRDLEIGMCDMVSLIGMPAMPSLRRLTLSRPRGLQGFVGINALPFLEELQVENAPHLADFSEIAGLRHLRHVSLIGCRQPESLEPFSGLPNLERLMVNGKDMLERSR